MILRNGLAHVFVFIAPVVVVMAIAVPALWLRSKSAKGVASPAPVKKTALKIAKDLSGWCLLAMPFVVLFCGTTVWVIDDGKDGALAWRKYLLFGKGGSVKRLDGQVIEIHAEPGRGDVVVNASSVQIQSEEVPYGQGAAGIPLERIMMAPSESRAVLKSVEAVGSPPYMAELKGGVKSAVKTYVHR